MAPRVHEELPVELDDITTHATLAVPPKPHGIVLLLHGAEAPDRDFALYRHVADVFTDSGWAVVSYDRRPAPGMVPLGQQVADALRVLEEMRHRPALRETPVGLWGFSQGAWTATMAAGSIPHLAFLALVGFSAVSPSRQMRYATENYLRRAGYGDAAVESLLRLRTAGEAYHRGDLDRDTAQAVVDRYREEPWFDLAYVPAELPEPSSIDDPGFFGFDPAPLLEAAEVPTLLTYGDTDIDVRVDESIAVATAAAPERVTAHRLSGAGHALMTDDGIDPRYASLLSAWLDGLSVG